jgi:hypothetical protein
MSKAPPHVDSYLRRSDDPPLQSDLRDDEGALRHTHSSKADRFPRRGRDLTINAPTATRTQVLFR